MKCSVRDKWNNQIWCMMRLIIKGLIVRRRIFNSGFNREPAKTGEMGSFFSVFTRTLDLLICWYMPVLGSVPALSRTLFWGLSPSSESQQWSTIRCFWQWLLAFQIWLPVRSKQTFNTSLWHQPFLRQGVKVISPRLQEYWGIITVKNATMNSKIFSYRLSTTS